MDVVKRQSNSQRDKKWVLLAGRFLAFLVGMQIPDGRLHNFMSYAHEMENDLNSGDHLGRALWATECVVDSVLPEGIRRSAKEVLDKALPWSIRSKSLAKAHAIKALADTAIISEIIRTRGRICLN
ncbi:MAG: hypothetical protein V1857_04715 [archaeon]